MIVMGSEWVSISDNCTAIFGLAPQLQSPHSWPSQTTVECLNPLLSYESSSLFDPEIYQLCSLPKKVPQGLSDNRLVFKQPSVIN